MPFDSITTEHAIAGGAGAFAGAILLWSKIRRAVAHDAADTSAHKSMQVAMEGLRAENARLHEEIGRLRTEIDRLRETVTTLTAKLADMSTAMSRGAVVDQLAREGKLERRKNRGEITTPFPQIDGLSPTP